MSSTRASSSARTAGSLGWRGRALLAGAATALAGCGMQVPDQGGPEPGRRAGYLIILIACGVAFGLLAVVGAVGWRARRDEEEDE